MRPATTPHRRRSSASTSRRFRHIAHSVHLPIDDVVDDLVAALAVAPSAVLQAPPGAGKTTRVPLVLVEQPWLEGQRIVLLEPRRIAARAVADRLAQQLGERVGQTVGLRMRGATEVSASTRIEVVTEGVLTQMLQSDPSLEGVGLVIFDEFHERSLHADVGLAFAIEVQAALRDDLRLLVMSATLDGLSVAALLGDAPIITSDGRQFPVETSYAPVPAGVAVELHAADVVVEVVGSATGDILCFLPGAGWIRRAERALAGRLPPNTVVTPLYGLLGPADQDRAIAPDPHGRTKVILATDIAETSLTIDGVDTVIDGGQRRSPRFDPRSGLSRLETVRLSRASADQRRGRAGRLGPGRCVRLWSTRDQELLAEHDPPEITQADLTGLRLELARWGSDGSSISWLDAPPIAALTEAEDVLRRLGAVDAEGRITEHGHALASLGAEPRLANMMVRAAALGLGELACDVAGLLSSRDPLRSESADLLLRVEAMRSGQRSDLRWGAMQEARHAAKRWRNRLGLSSASEAAMPTDVGVVVSLAFPERIARRRSSSRTYLMASGRAAELPRNDGLGASEWLAVAEVDGEPEGGRVFLAAELDAGDVERVHEPAMTEQDVVAWDRQAGAVVAERQRRLGAIVLKRQPIVDPPSDLLVEGWLVGLRSEGLGLLRFSEDTDRWRQRVRFLRNAVSESWPDVSDEGLLASAEHWLAPHLHAVRRRRDLAALDTAMMLRSMFDWSRQQDLDRLAPTHLTVPSGSSVRIDYRDLEAPVLAVRLQELFGLTETPTVAAGRVPLTLHLLSPAQRPVQVTQDLVSFWAETYPQVKAELSGRYPKHHWPDDPLTATPTNRTKRRTD